VVAARAFEDRDNEGADDSYDYTFTFSHVLRTNTEANKYVQTVYGLFFYQSFEKRGKPSEWKA